MEYTTGRDYSIALSRSTNVLESRYIANLMLEATAFGSNDEILALATRTNPVSLVITTGEKYVVVSTDGIEDIFDTEPLWHTSKDELKRIVVA